MATIPVKGSVNALIDSAARRGNIPDAQMTYVLSDFLAMVQEELFSYAMPVLHARRDDYYLEELTFSISNPDTYIGNGTVRHPAWRLPEYAMAGTIRDVQAVSASGTFYNLGRTMVDDVPNMTSQSWYFYGNYLVFQQNVASSTSPPVAIRCIVHVKPNQVTPIGTLYSDLGVTAPIVQPFKVTAVQTTTQLVIDVTPSTSISNGFIDIVSGEPGYEVTNRNVPITQASNTVIVTLGAEPSIPVKVGDWLCAVGYTPMIPLPLELHPLLAQRVVVKFLEAQGEEGQLQQARQSLDEMVRQVPLLIQPRAEGKPKKLAPHAGLWRRWRW